MDALRETKSRTYTVHVSKKDAAMFRSMAVRMGWTTVLQKPKKTCLQLAIEEAHNGLFLEKLMEHLMKYTVGTTRYFDKAFKRCIKRGLNIILYSIHKPLHPKVCRLP